MKTSKFILTLFFCIYLILSELKAQNIVSNSNQIDSNSSTTKFEMGFSLGFSLYNKINRGTEIDQFFSLGTGNNNIKPDKGNSSFQYINMSFGRKIKNGGIGFNLRFNHYSKNMIMGEFRVKDSINSTFNLIKLGIIDSRIGIYFRYERPSKKYGIILSTGIIYSNMAGDIYNTSVIQSSVTFGPKKSNSFGSFVEVNFLFLIYKGVNIEAGIGRRKLKITGIDEPQNSNDYYYQKNPITIDWGGHYVKCGLNFLI